MTVSELAETQAVILAGGLGTRLRSVISDRPKVLAKVGDRPFMVYLLEQLSVAGIQKVILCTGYLGAQVQTTFEASSHQLDLIYSQEPSPLGTGGALRLALDYIQSDSVLVMNGDSFCEISIGEFWLSHADRQTDVTIALTQVSDTSRYGRVEVDSAGKILNFAEKGNSTSVGWINAGIYLIKRELISEIPRDQVISLEQEILPNWIEHKSVYSYPTQGKFIDIGTPSSYALAQSFFGEEP